MAVQISNLCHECFGSMTARATILFIACAHALLFGALYLDALALASTGDRMAIGAIVVFTLTVSTSFYLFESIISEFAPIKLDQCVLCIYLGRCCSTKALFVRSSCETSRDVPANPGDLRLRLVQLLPVSLICWIADRGSFVLDCQRKFPSPHKLM